MLSEGCKTQQEEEPFGVLYQIQNYVGNIENTHYIMQSFANLKKQQKY